MEGERFDNKEGGVERGKKPHLDIIENDKYLYHEDYSHREAIAQAYISSIEGLLDAGKKVILIYPIPEAGWNVPDYLGRNYATDPESILRDSTGSTSYEVFVERNRRTIDSLNKIKSHKNLFRVFPEQIFCDDGISGRCFTHQDHVIYYRDDDHVSDDGARLIVERVIRYF